MVDCTRAGGALSIAPASSWCSFTVPLVLLLLFLSHHHALHRHPDGQCPLLLTVLTAWESVHLRCFSFWSRCTRVYPQLPENLNQCP